jgi:hypothetical protein
MFAMSQIEIEDLLIELYVNNQFKPERFIFPVSDNEIKYFLEIAKENKIESYLFLRLKALESKVKIDSHLMSILEDQYNKTLKKNRKRLEVGLPVLESLKREGIEVIILKGNAIAQDCYGDIGYKTMNDIDILIREKDRAKALQVFLTCNLFSAAHLNDDLLALVKTSHHFPPFFDKSLSAFFGIHWNIVSPFRNIDINLESLWEQKEDFTINNRTFYRLAPEHFLLHLCLHLSPVKTGLRELSDIIKILQKYDGVLSVDNFLKLVESSKGNDDVFESLTIVSVIYRSTFVNEFLKTIAPSVSLKTRERAAKRTRGKSAVLHFRTNYISKIEKNFALFTLTDSPIEKTYFLTKMWRYYLFIPNSIALKLSYEFPDTNIFIKTKAQILATINISKFFIHELGLTIFLVVTARHQWQLFKSYFLFVLKKIRGEKNYCINDYAKTFGLSLIELKELTSLD